MIGWISVNKKMPKEGETVFATGFDYGAGPSRHYDALRYKDGVFAYIDDEDGIYEERPYITHWMPIPSVCEED